MKACLILNYKNLVTITIKVTKVSKGIQMFEENVNLMGFFFSENKLHVFLCHFITLFQNMGNIQNEGS